VTGPPAPTVRYGERPDQVANLHRPAAEGGPWPVVVLVHGGFWRDGWDRTLMTPLAHDLAARGYLAWNVEYRRVGQVGGGWPGTLVDAAAAVDALEGVPDADLERIAAVGHSAGGHLALWLAARSKLPPDAPGASPRVHVPLAFALAGVCDLARGAEEGLGGGACAALLGGGPADVPERYAMASPAALLPFGTRQVLVHGGRDDLVPPSQSRDYAAAARAAGDDVELVLIDDADHFDLIGPSHRAWKEVADRLGTM
jgi:acetyl esterase/lipase